MSRKLFLLRHGQTEYNATGRMQGQLDTELSAVGRKQADIAAQYLSRQHIGRIISSDLSRAKTTAQAVASKLGVPVEIDKRLRETNLGQWQGKSHAEVDGALPGARAQWRHDATWAPPGGETRLEVADRARAVVDEMMASWEQWDDDHALLLVAHGGTIGALTSALLDVPVSHYPMFSGLKNTCWAELTARPKFEASRADQGVGEFAGAESAQWYLDGWNIGQVMR